MLPTSPDSQGIFCKRFNDLTFSPVLLDLFFKVANNKDPSCPTDVTASEETASFNLVYRAHHLTEISKESNPELFLRADQITQSLTNLPRPTWPQECLSRAIDLALNCLRISSYISLLLKTNIPISSEALIKSKLEMKPYHNQSISERYPNGTFPNGLLFNGTFPENGSYPSCIYPCGITPNGDFTMVTPTTNIFDKLRSIDRSAKDQLTVKKRLDRYHCRYPYYELLSEEHTWLIRVGANSGLYPCNITLSGVFLSRGKSRPYGPYTADFPYNKFFSGSLINETLGIYPGNIYPNGTFGDCSPLFHEPYGLFEQKFPYQDFFNGSFHYENRFVEQLNKTYLSNPESIERTDPIIGSWESNYLGAAVITSYWVSNSLSQLILTNYRANSHVGRKLKALALSLASTTLAMSTIDLCYNIRQASTNEALDTLATHRLIIVYDGMYLVHEIITFSSPWIKSKILEVAEKVTKIKGICQKDNLLRVTYKYQKSLQHARIACILFGLLLTSLLALSVNSKRQFSKNTSPSIESTFLSIFTSCIACVLLLFLCSVNRKG